MTPDLSDSGPGVTALIGHVYRSYRYGAFTWIRRINKAELASPASIVVVVVVVWC